MRLQLSSHLLKQRWACSELGRCPAERNRLYSSTVNGIITLTVLKKNVIIEVDCSLTLFLSEEIFQQQTRQQRLRNRLIFTGNQSNSLSNNATFLCCKPAEKTHRTDLDSGCLINLMYNRILSNLLSCCYNKFRYDWMQCAIYKINCISCISKEWSIYIFSLVGSPSSLKVAY